MFVGADPGDLDLAAVGTSRARRRQRASVVFPEPDSPTMPTLSPSPSSIDTPSSATTLPNRFATVARR